MNGFFFFHKEHLIKIAENTTSALEGLKTALYHLFSKEDIRISSLKGITATAGGPSTALDKQKLNLLYCK